jgi:hypothetical protein
METQEATDETLVQGHASLPVRVACTSTEEVFG